MPAKTHQQQSDLAVLLGLVSNIVLSILKTLVGIIGNSPALLADGINSTSDVVYYLVVALFIRASRKPADDEHPYGHTQFESIGALVVGAFVITTAVTIFWNSINALVNLLQGKSGYQGGSVLALYVAVGTVLLKILMYVFTSRIGKTTRNASIIALASDHRNDTLAASAAAVGIGLGRLGYAWVDPAAGALVAFFILATGISILRDATSVLMDTVPGKVLNEQIRELSAGVEGVRGVDDVRAHRFGQYYVINITICVDAAKTVRQGDAIASAVERTLQENISFVRDVFVHYHPGCDQSP